VLEVRFWADSRRSDLVATQSNVRTALVTAFRRVGIALPTPDLRRVRIENPPPGEGG
jgi:small conductance mechanosensitive channel